jgi:hypothetical protein
LLSRDPVEFNAAINSSFAPNVVYRGHGLEVRGAANLKHAAWFWNTIDGGKPATFSLNDIRWDEETQTATVRTQRFVRPRVWPFVGLAIEVPVRLQLQTSNGEALVIRFEEIWPTERILAHVPVVQAVHEAMVKSIWTLIVLSLSNGLFAAKARVNSSAPSLESVKRSLPAELTNNIGQGFQHGSHMANGYGNLAVDLLVKFACPPVRMAEASAQYLTLAAQRFVPFALPYPYVFNAHALPSQRSTSSTDEPSKNVASSSSVKQDKPVTQPAVADDKDDRAARVEVGPSVETVTHVPQEKSIQISSGTTTEAAEVEQSPAQETKGDSLYDKLRKEGQDPIAEAAEVAEKVADSAAAHSNGQQGSSGDEEGVKDGHKGNVNGGGAKKKKNKKKKNGTAGHANGASTTTV